MKGKIKFTFFLLGTLVALLLFVAGQEAIARVTGAIFTTDENSEFVNANVYDTKEDVYLNGGPRPNAPCTASGLPDGYYYFQVTDPSGKTLLSFDDIDYDGFDDIEEREVYVSNGVITMYMGTTHYTGIGKCSGSITSITVQLFPYETTPNPGNEYKVWMTPVSAYDPPDSGSFGFIPSESKTDNFKVISFVDTDGDGIADADDNCPDDPNDECDDDVTVE